MKTMAVLAAAAFPFLLAACSAGTGGIGGMGGCGMGHGGHGSTHGGSSHEGHEQPAATAAAVHPDANFDAAKMRNVLDAYDIIVRSLASDNVDGVADAAKKISADGPTGNIRGSALRLSQAAAADNLAESRQRFKEMTGPVATYIASNLDAVESALSVDGRPVPGKAYCPMADATWLQHGDAITNPFFGSSMLRCGEFQDWAATH